MSTAIPRRSQPALTPELVALVRRPVEDRGRDPNRTYLTDGDYDALVAEFMETAGGGPVWIFGYGSLLWKPGFAHVESRPALLKGWHRSFCLRLTSGYGTREFPGLMLALDRGGSCRGVAFRLPEGREAHELGRLFRREMRTKPTSNRPRWVPVRTPQAPERALAFTIDRAGPAYAGPLTVEAVADTLARACGRHGICAEYLLNTVMQLEALGMRDRNLWRLQRMVAERIRAARQGSG